ncbi:CDP-glycerol glycerophosphotransferase family protein [Luteimonas composti]|uniref:CDP-glycerol glycerophosphotransferase family protein n=1 Tax=Luteimonas composti TaxID=398257 RepID=A0ABT6MTV3_9GAMM|nr:CDP-glycerol glycerophosphotransferase family protein [Luteimonas composti]MDH7454071.1 CDP-glycerol glycerophosphotransferase family protein [Luteimonas composti]
MKSIHFNLDPTINYGDLQDTIVSTVTDKLVEAPWSSSVGEVKSDSVNVSLFIRSPAQVFLGHSLADRNYLWARDDEGKRLVNRFQAVLVPGRWMKNRLLHSPSIRLKADQVICVGSPRIDRLRALSATMARAPSGGQLKVLWAPTYSKRNGASVSSHPEFESHLAALAEEFDVASLLHPRQRSDKRAAVDELLWADVVISDTSSIIYEAWALGKPVVFPSWLTFDRVLDRYPKSAEAHIYATGIGYHAGSFEELRDILRGGPSIGDDVDRFMDEYLDNYRSGNASTKAANALLSLAGVDLAHQTLKALKEAIDSVEQADPATSTKLTPASDRQALVDRCDDLIRRPGCDSAMLEELGELLIGLKQYDAAERAYRELLNRDWTAARGHVHLAKVLGLQSKWWQAADSLVVATTLDSTHADWFFQLGDAQERMGRFEGAIEAYRAAIAIDPGEPHWHYRLGYMLERAGRTAQADIAYGEAIRRDGSADATQFGIGVFHQKRGLWEAALRAYEMKLEQSPLVAALHYRTGMANDRLYRWQQAAQHYRNAIALETRKANPQWHYRLGFVLERQGCWQDAADAYRAAVALSAKHTAYWHYRLGYVLEQAKAFEAACGAYVRTRLEPGLRSVHALTLPKVGTGSAGWLNAQDEEHAAIQRYLSGFSASGLLARIIEKDATSALDHFRLAESLEREEKWEAAADAYRHGLLRCSDHVSSRYFRLGYVLFRAGRHEQACAAFRSTRVLQRAHGMSEEPLQKDEGLRLAASYVEYSECLPVDDKAILYESFNGSSMSCNPLAIFKRLVEHPDFRDYLHIWVLNDTSRIQESYRRLPNVVFVAKPSDGYLRHLATAKHLINNSGFPPYFIRRPEQRYLATWHGTPLKTLGKEQKYKFYDHKRTQRNFVQSTHIISPNRHTTDIQLDSYDIRPLFTGLFAETGYPRVDLTLNADDAQKARIMKRMGLSADRPVVLYAPTWRGTLDQVSFDTSRLEQDLAELSKLDCQLVFRGHSLLERVMTHDDVPGQVVPADIDTNELLSVVDVLITDYSSVFFDYLATGKPILYYIYDLEEYEEERGLYFDMEEMPGAKCRTIEDLSSALTLAIAGKGMDSEHFRRSQAAYSPHDDGNATSRVIDFFFNDASTHLVDFREADRTTVVLNGGSFQPNGITTSFVNLVKSIDRSRYDVVLGFSPNSVEGSNGNLAQFRKLPKDIYAVPRYGNMPMTLEERWIRKHHNDGSIRLEPEMRAILERSYEREFVRIFGRKRYDVAAAFSGYDAFWASILLMGRGAKRKVIYLHNDMYSEHTAKFPELQLIFDAYKYADALVSVSEQTCTHNREQLADRFALDRDKFVHCDNLINPEEILDRSSLPLEVEGDESLFDGASPVLVNIARLSVEKDHEKLIRAFAEFRKQQPHARLLILGSGPLEQHLRRVVIECGLGDSVRLLGYRINPYPYLRRAHCFVLSSNHEGQPMTLLEALVLGKPIIATDIVGNRSVLHGRPGMLVDNSIEGLADGMRRLATGPVQTGGFDWSGYQQNAINAFYEKVTGIGPAPASI